MRAVIQRVKSASVKIEKKPISSIKQGYVVLLGIAEEDSQQDIDLMAGKIKNLRIFEDSDGKMNKAIIDIEGDVLVVPQFTLLADLDKGRRPSFSAAAKPGKAENIYTQVIDKLKSKGLRVFSGVFGAHMQIELINDGPVTIMLDTKRQNSS